MMDIGGGFEDVQLEEGAETAERIVRSYLTLKKKPQSWTRFCNTKSFAVPQQKDVMKRLEANLKYFQANYVVIFAALVIYTLYTQPHVTLWLGVILGAWYYVYVVHTAPIRINRRRVTAKEKFYVLVVGSAAILYFSSAYLHLIWTAGFAAAVILGHASFYKPGMRAAASNFVHDTYSEVSGGDTGFGGGGAEIGGGSSGLGYRGGSGGGSGGGMAL